MQHSQRVVVRGVQLRKETGKLPTAYGTALRYNDWSEFLYDRFYERFLPGAFTRTLAAKPDIIATIDHDTSKVIGRTSAGTLTLRDDDEGLHVEVPLPDTSYGRDLAVSIERGDIKGMSFTFDVHGEGERWLRKDGKAHREVSDADLYEVAFVTTPAYPTTDAGLRSLDAFEKRSPEDDAQVEGQLAKEEGEDVSSNPYGAGSEEAEAWLAGYNSSRSRSTHRLRLELEERLMEERVAGSDGVEISVGDYVKSPHGIVKVISIAHNLLYCRDGGQYDPALCSFQERI